MPYCSGLLWIKRGIPCGNTLFLSLRRGWLLKRAAHSSTSRWSQGIASQRKVSLCVWYELYHIQSLRKYVTFQLWWTDRTIHSILHTAGYSRIPHSMCVGSRTDAPLRWGVWSDRVGRAVVGWNSCTIEPVVCGRLWLSRASWSCLRQYMYLLKRKLGVKFFFGH